MSENIVVSLFDHSGVMVKPWLDAGFECFIVDKKHKRNESNGRLHKIHADLCRPWLPPFDRGQIAFVSAFPPCTHLAASGARWFKGKGLRSLEESIAMFATAAEFCDWAGAPFLIENPVSTISTYWRKPDHTYHPYFFAQDMRDNYRKKTCLWTGGGFTMPVRDDKLGLPVPDDRIHMAPDSRGRSEARSLTPGGFARAVFEANRGTT